MIESRKTDKKCYLDMLQLYGRRCQMIAIESIKKMNDHNSSSLSVLQHLFQSRRQPNKRDLIKYPCINTQFEQIKSIRRKQKQCKQSDSPQNFHQNHKYNQELLVKKHQLSEYAKHIKDVPQQTNQTLKLLSTKIKKMKIAGEQEEKTKINNDFVHDLNNDSQDEITHNKTEDKQLLKKDLQVLIKESQKKKRSYSKKHDLDTNLKMEINHDLLRFNQTGGDHLQTERVSQYNMTDYSSNESSNEGDYSAYYKQESMKNPKPLFGGLFKFHKINNLKQSFLEAEADSSIDSTDFVKNNFKAKQFLKSPKKSQKSRKRLFVGQKTIPHWAENLEEIALQSKMNKFLDTNTIYGKCKVQNLNTNLLFGINHCMDRTSSAKWKYHEFQK